MDGVLFQDGIKECIMPPNAAAKVAKTEHGEVADVKADAEKKAEDKKADIKARADKAKENIGKKIDEARK